TRDTHAQPPQRVGIRHLAAADGGHHLRRTGGRRHHGGRLTVVERTMPRAGQQDAGAGREQQDAEDREPESRAGAAEGAHLLTWGAPTWPPTPPNARRIPGNPGTPPRPPSARAGGPTLAPPPPPPPGS